VSLYEAFAAAEPAIHWKGELAARVRDILRRDVLRWHADRRSDAGCERSASAVAEPRRLAERVQALVRLIERGIEHSLPVDRVKSALSALLGALRRRGDASTAGGVATVAGGLALAERPADAAVLDELAELFVRIRAHGGGRQIESYSTWLFAVELDVRF